MTEALTFLAQEVGRAFALIWGGIGIAIKLNYEVMSIVVTVTSRIVQLLFLLTQKSAQVCSILANDLLLFVGDIGSGVIALGNTTQNLGKGLIGAVGALITSAVAACLHIYELILSFKCFIINLCIQTVTYIGYALNLVKLGCVLFGSSVIFAISFLPKLLCLIVSSTYQFIFDEYCQLCLFVQDSLLSGKQIISKLKQSVINYFTDIPISSVLGLCIGVLFIVFLKYLIEYVISTYITDPDIDLSSVVSNVKRRIMQWFVHIRRRNSQFEPMVSVEDENENDDDDDDNEYNWSARPSTENTMLRQPDIPGTSSSSSLSDHSSEETNGHIAQPSLTRKPLSRTRRALGLAADITDADVIQNKSPAKCKKPVTMTSDNNAEWAQDLYKELQDEREGKLCIICQDRLKRVILLPCRHLCLCDACRSAVIVRNNKCPICRKPILDSLRVFV